MATKVNKEIKIKKPYKDCTKGKFYSPANDPNYCRRVVGNKTYDLYSVETSRRNAQLAVKQIKQEGALSSVKTVKSSNYPVKQWQWFVYEGYKK